MGHTQILTLSSHTEHMSAVAPSGCLRFSITL